VNPISQVGLITTQNKRAELISELAGNPRKHAEHLKTIVETATNQSAGTSNGEPSLQNALEVAIQSLKNIPPHASREVMFF
jgi:transcription initiation factor TFIIH subunit 2